MKLSLKLLYQFRVMVDGTPGTYRQCDERYVVMDVENDDVEAAIDRFFAKIKETNFRSRNTDGNTFFYEFVGVLEFMIWELEPIPFWDTERDDEVEEFWYEYRVRKLPMENRKKLTISKAEMKKRLRQQPARIEENIRKLRGAGRLNNLTDMDWLMKNIERDRRKFEQEEREENES